MFSKVKYIGFVFLSCSVFAEIQYPTARQKMVVADYVGAQQKKPYFKSNSVLPDKVADGFKVGENIGSADNYKQVAANSNELSLTEAALVAQQAAVSVLTFVPKHHVMLEQLALRYFSQSGWQQAMTPQVLESRKKWLASQYRTVVMVNNWPEVVAISVNGTPVVKAQLSLLIDLYAKNKLLTRQPIQVITYLQPVANNIHWQISAWQSTLLNNINYNKDFSKNRF